MLFLEKRPPRILPALPGLARTGVVVVAAGLVLDVIAHLGWSAAMGAGHLVTLGGMAVAVVGVLVLAFRRPERPSRKGR